MAISSKDLVQRKHNYAIVDEVDSVLIDDARTPLIISGPVPKGDDQLFEEFRSKVEHLVKLQKDFTTKLLAEAKIMMAKEDQKEQDNVEKTPYSTPPQFGRYSREDDEKLF